MSPNTRARVVELVGHVHDRILLPVHFYRLDDDALDEDLDDLPLQFERQWPAQAAVQAIVNSRLPELVNIPNQLPSHGQPNSHRCLTDLNPLARCRPAPPTNWKRCR